MVGTLKARVSGNWVSILGTGQDAATTARWNAAWGALATQKSPGSSWSNATSSLTDITCGSYANSVTAYMYASRKYRLYFQAQFADTVAAGSEFVVLQMVLNGSVLSENNALWMPVANQGVFTWLETVYTPAADGMVTMKVQGRRGSSSTGTVSVFNANNAPVQYIIEDLGPISPAAVAPPTAAPYTIASGNALGIIVRGAAIIGSPTPIAASTDTAVTYPLNVYFNVGRRYRVKFFARATGPQTAASAFTGAGGIGNASFWIYDGGTSLRGNYGDPYVTIPVNYASLNGEWLIDGDDAQHSFTVHCSATVAFNLWTDLSSFYVEDLGPSVSPALPLPATPPAWSALSLSAGWSNYGGGYSGAQYRKIGDIVYCRGTVVHANGYNTAVFTLPAGFTPPTNLQPLVRCPSSSGSVIPYFVIGTNGVASLTGDGSGVLNTPGAVSFLFNFSTTA